MCFILFFYSHLEISYISTQIEVTKHIKHNIIFVFRSTFLNEPIKRMLFAMFFLYFYTCSDMFIATPSMAWAFFRFIHEKKGVCQTENMVIEIINNFENNLPNIYHVLLPIMPNEFLPFYEHRKFIGYRYGNKYTRGIKRFLTVAVLWLTFFNNNLIEI